MDHLLGYGINHDRSTCRGIDVADCRVSRVNQVFCGELFALLNGLCNLLWCPSPLLHLSKHFSNTFSFRPKPIGRCFFARYYSFCFTTASQQRCRVNYPTNHNSANSRCGVAKRIPIFVI